MTPAGSAGPPSDQDAVARMVEALIPTSVPASQRRLYDSMLGTIYEMAAEHTDVVDLKIANAALGEMAEAFRVFRPFRHERKVTIFGSARTQPDHGAYERARDLAASMAAFGWMVVTGAGPGIMAAGMEGAGREHSTAVNIRLPFEQGTNSFIAQDPKLVQMQYFFTRKKTFITTATHSSCLPLEVLC